MHSLRDFFLWSGAQRLPYHTSPAKSTMSFHPFHSIGTIPFHSFGTIPFLGTIPFYSFGLGRKGYHSSPA